MYVPQELMNVIRKLCIFRFPIMLIDRGSVLYKLWIYSSTKNSFVSSSLHVVWYITEGSNFPKTLTSNIWNSQLYYIQQTGPTFYQTTMLLSGKTTETFEFKDPDTGSFSRFLKNSDLLGHSRFFRKITLSLHLWIWFECSLSVVRSYTRRTSDTFLNWLPYSSQAYRQFTRGWVWKLDFCFSP